MEVKRQHERISYISPISIADIVLLLIIFFLLTSTYVLEPGIKVKLPRSTSSEVTAEKDIQVTITREGKLFLNQKEVTLEEFASRLRETIEKVGTKPIIIRADKGVYVDRLVMIMDRARLAGAEKFLIATRRIE